MEVLYMDIVSYAMGEGAGYKKGYADGQDSDAYTEGHGDGYAKGYTSGYDAGFPDGVASVNSVKDLIDVRDAQLLFSYVKNTTGGLSADQKIASVLNYSDTENASNFNSMFSNSEITVVPNFDTSNMISASSLFTNCYNLQNAEFDFSNLSPANLYNTFYGCRNLRNVSLSIDSSKKYSLDLTFSNCGNLHSVSFDKTPKVNSMTNTFNNAMLNAVDGETFPYMDTSEVTNFDHTFAVSAGKTQNALRTIPTYDLSGANTVSGLSTIFENRLIREIPDLILPELSISDWNMLFSSKNGSFYFFKGNTALSKLHFTDIHGSLDISVSTQFTREALLEIIGNLRDMTGSTSPVLRLGATNLAKLTEEDIAPAIEEKNWIVATG